MKLEEVRPATTQEKLSWEKELLGLYISSHPLENFKKVFDNTSLGEKLPPSSTIFIKYRIGGGEISNVGTRVINNIKLLELRSKNDYNQQYKKGSLLNNLCYIKVTNGGGSAICPELLSSYLNEHPECPFRFNLYFMEPPDSTRLHRFSINYEESDGTSYEVTTWPVYISL